MPASIEAVFDGQEMSDFLEAMQTRFSSASDGNSILAGIAYARAFRDVVDHFKHEEGPDGPWTAWSKIYAEHMDRIGKGGNKLLQDTGRLRQGFQISSLQPAGAIKFVNPVSYAAVHDQGGKRMPQRKFMWLSDEAMEDIGAQFLRWVEEGTK